MSLPPYVFGYNRNSRHMHLHSHMRQHSLMHQHSHMQPHGHWPNRLLDQDLGMALTLDNLISVAAPAPMLSEDYFKPWRLASLNRDLGSSIKSEKEKFQVYLDVQHFAPEDISVKTADGYIVVEGKHEEKKDEHGCISRQFTRRYALPAGAAPESVEARLSPDGVLTITVLVKLPEAIQRERKVPIVLTGPGHKEMKVQSNVTKDK